MVKVAVAGQLVVGDVRREPIVEPKLRLERID